MDKIDEIAALPFDLVDPLSKKKLIYKNYQLQADKNIYKLTKLDNTNKIIINFNPNCQQEKGAYKDEFNDEFAFEGIKGTGASFTNCYKSIALRKLNKYLKQDSTVLDLGCSNTEILHSMSTRFIKIGVDISFTALFGRTPNAIDSNVQHLWLCDATNLPLPNSSIDCILCCDIAEHLFNPEELIKEVYRVLKPGGKIFISVPNLVSIGNRLSFLFGDGRGIQIAQLFKFKTPITPITGPRYPDQVKHLRWFTAKSLVIFLKNNNFSIVSKFGVGPIVSRLKIGSLFTSSAHLIGIIAQKRLNEDAL
jgi:SAM-dependent methyltransferase